MFKRPQKQKEAEQIELTCSTCGKPIAGKARTDVTRYLFLESRCQCGQPKLVLKEGQEELKNFQALPYLDSVNAKSAGARAGDIPKQMPGWQMAILANLPAQYESQSLIGEGGMGTVWKVRDKNLNKTFAIKILRSEATKNREAMLRFMREAQAASQLTHPNLASVYSFAVGRRGDPYIVMDYIDGDNLGKIIQNEGCLDVPRAIDLFMQIAEAIEYAHSKGVIHRDVKPTNIIVQRNQDGIEIAKLVDFGIAKLVQSIGQQIKTLTRCGDVFGTPSYMSPEQCLGKKLDARSDIYALGCVMYESLSGKKPFASTATIQTMLKRITGEAVPLGQASAQQKIPDDLEYIVMRCLERKPENRYQSIQELEVDLQLFKEHKKINRRKKAPSLVKASGSASPKKLLPHHIFKFAVLFSVCAVYIGFLSLIATDFWHRRNPEAKLEMERIESEDWPAPRPEPFIGAPHILPPSHDSVTQTTFTDGSLARQLDDLSETYIKAKEYDKAIPLLQLSANYYRDAENDPLLVSDNFQSIGKCYKMLGKYALAEKFYRMAFQLLRDRFDFRPVDPNSLSFDRDFIQPQEDKLFSDLIRDWADVLVKLDRPEEAKQLREHWYIDTLPPQSNP